MNDIRSVYIDGPDGDIDEIAEELYNAGLDNVTVWQRCGRVGISYLEFDELEVTELLPRAGVRIIEEEE